VRGLVLRITPCTASSSTLRIDLSIEDTHRGIRIRTSWGHNGVLDNNMQSIAMLLSAGLAFQIRKQCKTHSLVIDEDDTDPRRGLPRV
jgi:hypothetical protein